MPYTPQRPDETVEAWEARLATDYETLRASMPGASAERVSHAWQTGAAAPDKHARTMSPGERAEAIQAARRIEAGGAKPIPVHLTRHVRDMTPVERAQAAAALGVSNWGRF